MLFNTRGGKHSPQVLSSESNVENALLPIFVDIKPEHLSTTQIERYFQKTRHQLLATEDLSISVQEWPECLADSRIAKQQKMERNILYSTSNVCPHGYSFLTEKASPSPREPSSWQLSNSRGIIRKSHMKASSHNEADAKNENNICATEKPDHHRGQEHDQIHRVNTKVTPVDDGLCGIITKEDEAHSERHVNIGHLSVNDIDKLPKNEYIYKRNQRNLFHHLAEDRNTNKFNNMNIQSFNLINSPRDMPFEDTPVECHVQGNINWNKRELNSCEDTKMRMDLPYSNPAVDMRNSVCDQQVYRKPHNVHESRLTREIYPSPMLRSGDSLHSKQLCKTELMSVGREWYKHVERFTRGSPLFLSKLSSDPYSLRRVVVLNKVEQGNSSKLLVGYVTIQGKASYEIGVSQVALGSDHPTHELAYHCTDRLYALNQKSEIQPEVFVAVELNLACAILAHPSVGPVKPSSVWPLLGMGPSSTALAMKVPTYRAKHCGVQTVLTTVSSNGGNFNWKELIGRNHLAQIYLLLANESTNKKLACSPNQTVGIMKSQMDHDKTNKQHTITTLSTSFSSQEDSNMITNLPSNGKPIIFKSIPGPTVVEMSPEDIRRTGIPPKHPEMAYSKGLAEPHGTYSSEKHTHRHQKFLLSTGNKDFDQIENKRALSFSSQNIQCDTKQIGHLKTAFETATHNFGLERPNKDGKRDQITSSPIRFPRLDNTYEFGKQLPVRKSPPIRNSVYENTVMLDLNYVPNDVQPVCDTNPSTSVDGGCTIEKGYEVLNKSCKHFDEKAAEVTSSTHLVPTRKQLSVSIAMHSESKNSPKTASEGNDIVEGLKKKDDQGLISSQSIPFIGKLTSLIPEKLSPAFVTCSNMENTKCMRKVSPSEGNILTESTKCGKRPLWTVLSNWNSMDSTVPESQYIRIPPQRQNLSIRKNFEKSETITRIQSSKCETEPSNTNLVKHERKEQKLNEILNESITAAPHCSNNINSLLGAEIRNSPVKEYRNVHFQIDGSSPTLNLGCGSPLFLEALRNTRRSVETTLCAAPAPTKYSSLNKGEGQQLERLCVTDMEQHRSITGSMKGGYTETSMDGETSDYSWDFSLNQDSQHSDGYNETSLLNNIRSNAVLKAVNEHVFNAVQSTLHRTLFFSLTEDTQHNVVTGIPKRIQKLHSTAPSAVQVATSSENITHDSFEPSNGSTVGSWSDISTSTCHVVKSSSQLGKRHSPKASHVRLKNLDGRHEKGTKCGLALKDPKTSLQSAAPYEPHRPPSRLRSLWCCTPWKYDQYKLSP